MLYKYKFISVVVVVGGVESVYKEPEPLKQRKSGQDNHGHKYVDNR